ncbi:DPP IV N-terminal domain-containing protein [Streptomyces sp. NPDC006195]|uniref:DPP IV N-terminal domain-containing protein n=1 Tax=unclassified Streptomyces TaxID=2593676 RepID=UPI0033BEF76B
MNTTDFPLRFARTRRFSLGVPRQFTVSPDGERVLFVRSVSGVDPRSPLWLYENGEERILAGPSAAVGDESVSDAERIRRERARETSVGVVGYATDREARIVAYALGGALWLVRTDGGAPWRIRTEGPVVDPRPSPDGAHVAYVSGGALRVVRTDGTDDRPLAGPESPDVTYGLADHTAAESIGRARGYWWSPDGDALLVARVDTSMVRRWYLGDPSDPARAPRSVPYPAAGTANARTSLRVVTLDGRHTPVRLPERAPEDEAPAGVWRDPAFEYVVGAGWESAGPVVGLQTRDQRTLWVLRVDPADGEVERLFRRTDAHWVEWLPGAPLHTASGTAVLPCVRGDAFPCGSVTPSLRTGSRSARCSARCASGSSSPRARSRRRPMSGRTPRTPGSSG